MAKVELGDRACDVRTKIGMEKTDYLVTWRRFNQIVQAISNEINGNRPLKLASTLTVIDQLKEHFSKPVDGVSELEREAINSALQVDGAAAWIVHNAIKKNYDKYMRNTQHWSVLQANQSPSSSSAPIGSVASNPVRERFDPVRER